MAPVREFPVGSLGHELLSEGYNFTFFQAVRVLEWMYPDRQPVGFTASPHEEIVRFQSLVSLSFPPSQIYDIVQETKDFPVPRLTATFFGLVGPSGILPRHYTELMMRLQRESREPERFALRDWLDLFSHRLLSHFYRAWKKYRFYLRFEQNRIRGKEIDPISQVLLCLGGLGTQGLQNRLQVSYWDPRSKPHQRPLARIDDLGLVFYSGLLSHRPRHASGLEGMLSDFFQLQAQVQQFHGQWLLLGQENQSRLQEQNNTLDMDMVIGERVWDVQGKIRIRLGPLDYTRFCEFIPDRSPTPQRKAFFLLVQLVRLYVGPDLTFDVQLILKPSDVPECCLNESDPGPQLGWNTWLTSQEMIVEAEDAFFEGQEVLWTNDEQRLTTLGLLR